MSIIDLNEYNYFLPEERIAQYPVKNRDMSKLLLYRNNTISTDFFRNIERYLPSDSLLVFNNTNVIRARLLFQKETGSVIEIFCLEPLSPGDYELAFSSKQPVEWKCIIGNLKKWKNNKINGYFGESDKHFNLTAEKKESIGESWKIKFSWDDDKASFGEVIEASGHIPLPPYINREDDENDQARYQTVYSKINGSVAAPTAGLHFTKKLIEKLNSKGVKQTEITLHVGAGTFKPVRNNNISEHLMHCEHFFFTKDTIELLSRYPGKIIPVGTTSLRALESLYWLGVKISRTDRRYRSEVKMHIGQWEPYEYNTGISVQESSAAIIEFMDHQNTDILKASTNLMIIPGYDFRMTSGLITNFHLPRSTLLLLVSAWIGKEWKKVYNYALANNYRFLSYGDCSLLFR